MNPNRDVCQTCLATGRKLFPIINLKPLLYEIQIWKQIVPNGGVCWECKSIMVKFITFKGKVKKAQEFLLMGKQLPELSSLVCKTNFNFEVNLDDDPLFRDTPLKQEFGSYIKTEPDNADDTTEFETYVDASSDHFEKKFSATDVYAVSFTAADDLVKDEENKKTESSDHRKVKAARNDNAESVKKEEFKSEEDKAEEEQIKSEEDKVNETFYEDRAFMEKFSIIQLNDQELEEMRIDQRNDRSYKRLPYKCNSCVIGFMRNNLYKMHLTKHDKNSGEFECSVCKIRFSQKSLEKEHRMKHFLSYKCKLCCFNTSEKRSALNHCFIHGSDTENCIHCLLCGHEASSPQEMEVHKRSLHPHYCEECGKEFISKKSLAKHTQRIHGVSRDFKCDVCRKTFVTKSRMESHMVLRHAELKNKMTYCELCNVQFKSLIIYRSHLRTSKNHARKEYECDICKKSFHSKSYLSQHITFQHLKSSKFECTTCNKMFASSWKLKSHCQSNHGLTRTRDFPCHVCGKRFYNRQLLSSHVLIHSEVRSFMCSECGDTFKQKAVLFNHTRLVHKGFKRQKI